MWMPARVRGVGLFKRHTVTARLRLAYIAASPRLIEIPMDHDINTLELECNAIATPPYDAYWPLQWPPLPEPAPTPAQPVDAWGQAI